MARRNFRTPDDFASRVRQANLGSLSFAQRRADVAVGDRIAHKSVTRQPSRDDPEYVYVHHLPRADFRAEASRRWAEDMASAHPPERAGVMRAQDRARARARRT